MKNILNVLFCLLISIILTSELKAQTNVPDANFRAVLSNVYGIAFDGSNNITNPETAASITSIYVNNKAISDLTGIAAFTGLQSLYCNLNSLTTLDISANTALYELNCRNNNLDNLDVSVLTGLKYLYCDNNNLSELDLTANTALEYLSCNSNNLSTLDLSNNPALTTLVISSNNIIPINLSVNINLQYLDCSYNSITNLDVDNSPNLTTLDCHNNQLTSLDVSKNSNLTDLYIDNNLTPFTLTVWELPFPPASVAYFSDTDPASTKVFGDLPVELYSFTAQPNNGKIQLNWSTVTESNNSGWEVESRIQESGDRSQNNTWKSIGFITGKGTTTEKQNYSFSVSSLQSPAALVEFRLKQIDMDGKFSYSEILSVDLTPETYSLSQNYPNPFNPTTAISYRLSALSNVKLVVFDLLGREVATLVNEKKEAGNYSVNFNASNLTSGVYFYKLTAGSFTETKKMTLVK